MSPLPRQGWLFFIEFLNWYFSKYWQVRTRLVFAQTVTYIHNINIFICILAQGCEQIGKSMNLPPLAVLSGYIIVESYMLSPSVITIEDTD